jgi:hypothetical protein
MTTRLPKHLRGSVAATLKTLKDLPPNSAEARTLAANGQVIRTKDTRYSSRNFQVIGDAAFLMRHGLAVQETRQYGESVSSTINMTEFGWLVLGRLGYKPLAEKPKTEADKLKAVS